MGIWTSSVWYGVESPLPAFIFRWKKRASGNALPSAGTRLVDVTACQSACLTSPKLQTRMRAGLPTG